MSIAETQIPLAIGPWMVPVELRRRFCKRCSNEAKPTIEIDSSDPEKPVARLLWDCGHDDVVELYRRKETYRCRCGAEFTTIARYWRRGVGGPTIHAADRCPACAMELVAHKHEREAMRFRTKAATLRKLYPRKMDR